MNAHEPLPEGTASPIVRALLGEIATALGRPPKTGGEPVAPPDPPGPPETDPDALETALGDGELPCDLEVAGRSEVRETAFSGVWWVRHFATDDRIVTREIAITRCPDILASHPDDVAAAASRLAASVAAPVPHVSVEEPSRG